MEPTEAGSETNALGPMVQIDEGKIQAHLDEVVRSTVCRFANYLAHFCSNYVALQTAI
jgi:hypothetical protein